MEKYDVIIIGAGPAGLSAAIYAARYKLKTLILSKDLGGLAATAHKICNYPSYREISGMELMQKFADQVKDLKVPVVYEEVQKIKGGNSRDSRGSKDSKFSVKTTKGEYCCKKIIFAGGTVRSKLGVKNEDKYVGRGVSYCATCDAAFFKGKIVAVVGGADAALTSALLLTEFAKKVYVIYRQKKYRAEPTWIDLVNKNSKIQCLCGEEIKEIIGKDKVEGIKLKSGREIKLDGIFVEVGSSPDIGFLLSLKIKRTKKGYICVDKDQRTSLKGVYAAGDITDNSLKQIVTAAGQGATAAFTVFKDIREGK